MPTQHAILPGSVNEYQQKLGSKWAYHAMYWSRICVPRVGSGAVE